MVNKTHPAFCSSRENVEKNWYASHVLDHELDSNADYPLSGVTTPNPPAGPKLKLINFLRAHSKEMTTWICLRTQEQIKSSFLFRPILVRPKMTKKKHLKSQTRTSREPMLWADSNSLHKTPFSPKKTSASPKQACHVKKKKETKTAKQKKTRKQAKTTKTKK